MLLDPKAISQTLEALTNSEAAQAPHTALLLLPQGRLLATASSSNLFDTEDGEDYLETDERLRLLSGLAAQWHPDESPKMECELGRILFRSITPPDPEVVTPNAIVPTTRPPVVASFVLLLNSTTDTPWSGLTSAADRFMQEWMTGI